MPKEKIHDLVGLFDVIVGWSPGGEVQVAVEASEATSILERLYGPRGEHLDDYQLKELGRSLAEVDPSKYVDEGLLARDVLQRVAEHLPRYAGLWTTLDRSRANRVIDALRKGRNAAFGKDA